MSRLVLATLLLAACAGSSGGGDDTDTTVDTDTVPLDTDPGGPCPEADPFCHVAAGLSWTDLSSDQHLGATWEIARQRCEDLGGRLPSITELRGLVTGCAASEAGGACLASDTCQDFMDCGGSCTGCPQADDGRYSVFGDVDTLWSRTPGTLGQSMDRAWTITFSHAIVATTGKDGGAVYRCVR